MNRSIQKTALPTALVLSLALICPGYSARLAYSAEKEYSLVELVPMRYILEYERQTRKKWDNATDAQKKKFIAKFKDQERREKLRKKKVKKAKPVPSAFDAANKLKKKKPEKLVKYPKLQKLKSGSRGSTPVSGLNQKLGNK